MKRYLLHVRSSKNRESIQKNGLTPRSIAKSPYFDDEFKQQVDDSYKKPKIFATTFKDEIDVYDLLNVKQSIYAIPAISVDDWENYEERAKEKIDFNWYLTRINDPKTSAVDKAKFIHEAEFELANAINELYKEHGKYDVWLIDNNIAKVNWKEDPFGGETDAEGSVYGNSSVMTSQPIKPEALELIVASGKNIKIKRFNESIKLRNILFETNNYPFKLFYDDARKKYGEPLQMGEYIGTLNSHDCDKNSFKNKNGYEIFKGEIVPKNRSLYDGTKLNHIFNVKNNKVYEFTNLNTNKDDWKNNYFYFGRPIQRNVKLKTIWNEYILKEIKKDIQNVSGIGNIEFESTSTDSFDNQVEMVTYAFLPGGKGYDGPWIAYCEYSLFENEINIEMIEVRKEYRRHKIANMLINKIKKENPGVKINYGYSTNSGSKLVNYLNAND